MLLYFFLLIGLLDLLERLWDLFKMIDEFCVIDLELGLEVGSFFFDVEGL